MFRTVNLLVNCSGAKIDGSCLAAIDLYDSAIFRSIRSHIERLRNSPAVKLNVLILSAKYGIVAADDLIDNYDLQMADQDVDSLVSSTHRQSFDQLRDLDGELYVMLSRQYMVAWDKYLTCFPKSALKRFDSVYESRNHCGIGQLKGRISKVLKRADSQFRPLPYRSGVSNDGELGYLAAGQSIGISLANVNTTKLSFLRRVLNGIESNSGTRLFIDNGLIKLLNSGQDQGIDERWVFDEYKAIAEMVSKNARQQICCVIPDSIDSYAEAQRIVAMHRQLIIDLMDMGIEMILPIHKPSDNENISIEEHAHDCALMLNNHVKLVLGVPCLKKPASKTRPSIDLRLPSEFIERLFQLKSGDHPLFARVHYLGLSEVSYSHKHIRFSLARMYGLECTMDANRTPALFGVGSVGQVKAVELDEKYRDMQRKVAPVADVMRSDVFLSHDYELESGDSERAGIVTERFYDLLSSDPEQWYEVWNYVMAGHGLAMDYAAFADEEEAIEKAWELVSFSPLADRVLFRGLKLYCLYYLDTFRSYLTTVAMSTAEKRFSVIASLFEGTELSKPINDCYQLEMAV